MHVVIPIFLLFSCLSAGDVSSLGQEFFGAEFQAHEVEPIKGGSVNPIYKVTTDEGVFVFRFAPDWQAQESFDREVEISMAAFHEGISPAIYYVSPHMKAIIMEYVPSKNFSELSEEERNNGHYIESLVDLLKKTHALPLERNEEPLPYAYFSKIEKKIDGRQLDFEEEIKQWLKYVRELQQKFSNEIVTFIHGDLHLGNELVGEEKIYLIDWTFSKLGDPFFDLAKLSHGFFDREAFLIAYLGRGPTDDEKEHFKLMYALALLEKYFEHIEEYWSDKDNGNDPTKSLEGVLKAKIRFESYVDNLERGK